MKTDEMKTGIEIELQEALSPGTYTMRVIGVRAHLHNVLLPIEDKLQYVMPICEVIDCQDTFLIGRVHYAYLSLEEKHRERARVTLIKMGAAEESFSYGASPDDLIGLVFKADLVYIKHMENAYTRLENIKRV